MERGSPAEAIRVPLNGKSGNVQRISICDGSVLLLELSKEKRYLTKDHVICLMPSAGIEAPCGGDVIVIPVINISHQSWIPMTEEVNKVQAPRRK